MTKEEFYINRLLNFTFKINVEGNELYNYLYLHEFDKCVEILKDLNIPFEYTTNDLFDDFRMSIKISDITSILRNYKIDSLLG